MDCVFCEEKEAVAFQSGKNAFFSCPACGGIFRSPESRLGAEAQRARYLLHHNDAEDPGYRTFLERFAAAAFSVPEEEPHTILDYGCGPEPALVRLLTESRAGIPDTCIRGWDPFFAPDTPFFPDGADIVLCLEVAEHFETPRQDFIRLRDACKTGGYVAVGTLPLPPGGKDAFDSWWYKEDLTHVSFYTLGALTSAAGSAGLTLKREIGGRVFVFVRET